MDSSRGGVTDGLHEYFSCHDWNSSYRCMVSRGSDRCRDDRVLQFDEGWQATPQLHDLPDPNNWWSRSMDCMDYRRNCRIQAEQTPSEIQGDGMSALELSVVMILIAAILLACTE